MSERLTDYVPASSRAALEEMGRKLGVDGETLACAILAWDAIKKLPRENRAKALAVVTVMVARVGTK